MSFWSNIANKNIFQVVDVILEGTSFMQKDVKVLSQSNCNCSSYVDFSQAVFSEESF